MSNDAKKVSQLNIVSNSGISDRLVILTNPSGIPALQTITLLNVGKSLVSSNSLPIANSTQLGIVKIGSGIDVTNNGTISANLNFDTGDFSFTNNVISLANNVDNAVFRIGDDGGTSNSGFVFEFVNAVANLQLLKIERDGHLVTSTIRSRIASGNAELVILTGPSSENKFTFSNTGSFVLATGEIQSNTGPLNLISSNNGSSNTTWTLGIDAVMTLPDYGSVPTTAPAGPGFAQNGGTLYWFDGSDWRTVNLT